MALDRVRLRLELELTKVGDPHNPITNLFSGSTPVMPRSRAIRWELVLLNDDALDADVGNITDITFEVKAYLDPTSAPLISKSTSTINTALTDAQRQARSDQHAVIEFAAGDTGLSMTGANAGGYKNFSIVITATRSGNLVTLAAGTIQVLNDGGQYSGNTPTAGAPEYYTKTQVDGLLAGGLKQLNEPGVALILVSPDGHWHRRIAIDNDGNPIDETKYVP